MPLNRMGAKTCRFEQTPSFEGWANNSEGGGANNKETIRVQGGLIIWGGGGCQQGRSKGKGIM